MILLRHGQSYFNLHYTETRVDPGIEDPELTPLGYEQARAAAAGLKETRLTGIIVSPYTRALQTVEAFQQTHDVPVQVMQEVRERAAFVCDIGSPPAHLAARFPHHDFSHLPACWWHEGVESTAEIIVRAAAFRKLMMEREDSATTLLVSHWAFILALTGISVGNGQFVEYDPHLPAPAEIVWRP
jgi:glucosyl-3-phosphoglycerate phosphatase